MFPGAYEKIGEWSSNKLSNICIIMVSFCEPSAASSKEFLFTLNIQAIKSPLDSCHSTCLVNCYQLTSDRLVLPSNTFFECRGEWSTDMRFGAYSISRVPNVCTCTLLTP